MNYPQEQIKPYSNDGKKSEQVEQMFDNIAPAYDQLNHTLSLGIDRSWRRKAINWLKPFRPQQIMDVATGTGDFAILACRELQPDQLIGTDISEGMMNVGREKVKKEGLSEKISFAKEDCTSLSFADNRFDAITVAFGIRNFEDLDKGTFDDVVKKYFPKKDIKSLSLKQRIKNTIKPYYFIFKKFGFSFRAYTNFIKINYRKNTSCNFKSGNVIYTMPSSVFDIHPSAKIDIKAPMLYGNNPVKGMRIPTCLRMEANTTLEIHDGPLTRYGKGPYNLRYGAYIEIVNGGKLTIGQGAANVGFTVQKKLR